MRLGVCGLPTGLTAFPRRQRRQRRCNRERIPRDITGKALSHERQPRTPEALSVLGLEPHRGGDKDATASGQRFQRKGKKYVKREATEMERLNW